MDRRAIVRTGLLFGAVSGVFALAVQLVGFYIIRDQNPWTSIAGAMLELLIIGEAGRVLGRASGRVAAGVWAGAIAGGLNELINHTLGDAAFTYSPAGQGAWGPPTAGGPEHDSDPPDITVRPFMSQVLPNPIV